MPTSHAFAIEIHGRPAGIVVSDPSGFVFFAAERTFYALERRVFKDVAHAQRAAQQTLAAQNARRRG
ncbi:Conjugal transfer protein TraA [Azospirillaceae bacterium]